MNKNISKLFFLFVMCLGSFGANAQIQLGLGGTPEELANLINGNGVQILNPTITCADSAFGTFEISSIPDLPDFQGLVLSTGNIFDMYGPNISQTTTTEWFTPGDPQLTTIAGGTSFDACIFEFDVVPVGDTLRFNFTFASEEYEEYVGTVFNDVFAFLISGPGIVGTPGLGGFENIALIPGTATPVSINTVNNGNPDLGFPAVNPDFFVSNPQGFNTQFEYDGFTTGLFAERVLTACDTFRLKLAIADVGDRRWDSSVFIEAIESNSITLSASTVGEIDEFIEGCNDGTVVFTRTPVSNSPLDVTFFIGGTATNGVDYAAIGDPDPDVLKTITIPAGQASAAIDIITIDDGIEEGPESIIFYIGNPFCPGTVQDSLEVFIIDELEVEIDPPLAFICSGEQYTFVVNTIGTGFSWSPPTFLDDPNIKEPTASPPDDVIYTLTTTVSECVATATGEIRVSNIVVDLDITNIACGGANDGAINTVVSGGEIPYEYEWSGPEGFSSTEANISGLTPGTYSLIVIDREGCTDSVSVSITEIAAITAEITSPEFDGGNNVSCNNAADGQATVMVSGGTPGYTYQWNDPANQTGQTATGLSAGNYTVTITDGNACVGIASITLTQPDPITGELEERDDVLCFGQSTGNVLISALGGTPPYNFLWNTVPPQAGPEATGLPAGFFSVTITDVNGCIGSAQVEIQEPQSPLSGNVLTIPPSCNGLSDGSASANVNGGTPPYTYIWSAQPGNNSNNISGLGAGQYNLIVVDDNDCELSIPFNVSQPAPLVINIVSQTDVDCFGASTGSVAVNATGGTGTIDYSWNTVPETQGPALSSVAAGSYTVTATDANGCSSNLEVIIAEPENSLQIDLVSLGNPGCDGFSDGSIEVAAQGGTAPYTYEWNTIPPTTGSSITGLGEGSITVTATDAQGCQALETFNLTAPDPIILEIVDLQNVLCNGESTGSATIASSGGTPPYSYLWNDPAAQTGATASNLAAGNYLLTVTDDGGCTADIEVTIIEPQNQLGGNIIQVIDVLCFGDESGLAQVSGTGGSGSYSYQWDDPNFQQGSVASDLAPGTYTVSITDNNGCPTPFNLDVTISGPDSDLELELLPSLFNGGFNVVCADDSTATIDLVITGGTAPYEVLWDLPGLDTSTDLNLVNLAPGVYAVSVSDANGCTENAQITLTAPSTIEFSAVTTPSPCFGAAQGSISIDILGGVPGYTASWEGPSGFVGSGTELTGIEGGVYFLTIEDASGCILQDAVTVIQPEDLTISVDSISDINGFNTSCWNSQDGAIFITPGGGTTPYSYVWNSPGNPNFSNQQNVTNVGPGTYEVVLIDENGCIQNEFIDIVGPDPVDITFDLSLFPNGFNVSCNGQADGSITALATGGSPPYNLTWIGTGGFGPVFGNPVENLVAGEYSVLIQDANNCTSANSISISEPPAFSITLFAESNNGSNITCEGESNGSIILTVAGSSGPYTFEWSGPNGFMSTSQNISGLEAGTYCSTVTDVNGCTETACTTLSEPETLSLTLDAFFYPNGSNLSCGNAADGAISSNISGGTAPFTYSWSGPGNFTSNIADISGLDVGTYCLTITDANACTTQACVELSAEPGLVIELQVDGSLACEGDDNANISATITGGSPPLAYAWSGPDGFAADTQDIDGLAAGQYCLTVTDAENCVAIACTTIQSAPAISLSLTTSTFEGGNGVSCNGSADGFVLSTVSGGESPYSYEWTGPNGFVASSASISNVGAGSYCLTITDANDCIAQVCADITEPIAITADAGIILPNCSDSGLATVTITASGGTSPYTYNWSNGSTSQNVTLNEGNYTVIVSDANNCEITLPVSITFPSAIFVTLQSPLLPGGVNVACHGEETGIINTTVTGGTGTLGFEWSGIDNFFSDEESLIGMGAGSYCLLVTDEQGCTGSACITLTQPEPLTMTLDASDVACASDSTGSLTANVQGGIPVYSISWTGPDGYTGIGTSISQLPAGEYCATAIDLNGCSLTMCMDIEQPLPIAIDLDSPEQNGVNIACFGDNSGAIAAEVNGGTAPYSYSWTGPEGFLSPSPNIENLFAGEYCLTITDANDCVSTMCIILTEPESLIADVDVFTYANGFNTSCGGECDGSLTLTLSGGTAPFDISWIGPDNFSSSESNLNDLCAGLYILNTIDAAGCEQTFEVVIEQPEAIEIDLDSPLFGGGTAISCFGASNGVVNTAVSGGLPEFMYSWTGPDDFESTDANIDNLGPGTYILTVTDNTGCTATAGITLIEPESLLSGNVLPFVYPSGHNISCVGLSDGSIEATGVGGIAPYTYNWLGPDDFSAQTADIDNLAPGLYTLVIEDANSCVFTINITLTEPDGELEAILVNIGDLDCHNDANGSLEIGAVGGAAPYEIIWIGPNGFNSDLFAIDGLPAGTYTYAVSDINGCNVSGAITLINPLEIIINAEIVEAICSSETGIINTTVSGGNPPYTFDWSTGDTTQNLINVGSGEYTLVVSDANGCEQEATFTVATANNLEFDTDITEPNCFGDSNGVLQLILLSGEEPVMYSWEGPDGFSATGNTLVDIAAGAYELTAIDNNGCILETTYIITQPDSLTIEPLVSPLFSNGFNLSAFESGDGVINNPEISGGSPVYNISWSGPEGYVSSGAGQQAGLIAGTYMLNVSDTRNCSATSTITLTQPIPIELPNGISPNGDGFNDGLIVRGLEGFPNNKVLIYNRWGILLYEEDNYSNNTPWAGTSNGGDLLPQGTYFVIVELRGRDSLRGYLELRR